MKTCPKCSVDHSKSGKFCSRKCANSRSWSADDRLKKSKSADNSTKVRKAIYLDSICQCGKEFKFLPYKPKKYCSVECSNNFVKRPSGGYRTGSGRSKSGYYKEIYCGSTYELAWIIYSLDHQVKFTRFDGCLEKNGIKYYPDFLLNDNKTIIEIKGFENQDSVDKKTAVAESFGYTVLVLRKHDLQFAFDYVKQHYGDKKLHMLYDNYKPKYSYSCVSCNQIFDRDKKSKTDVVFCSRQCAGKGHKGRVKSL